MDKNGYEIADTIINTPMSNAIKTRMNNNIYPIVLQNLFFTSCLLFCKNLNISLPSILIKIEKIQKMNKINKEIKLIKNTTPPIAIKA